MAAPGHYAHHSLGSAAGLATVITTVCYGIFASYHVLTDTRAITTDSNHLSTSSNWPLPAISTPSSKADYGVCYPLNGTGVTWNECIVPDDFYAGTARFATPYTDWLAYGYLLLLCILGASCLGLVVKTANAQLARLDIIFRERAPCRLLRLCDFVSVAYASYTQTVALASIAARILSQDTSLPCWTTPALLIASILRAAWHTPDNKLEIAQESLRKKDNEMEASKASLSSTQAERIATSQQLNQLKTGLEDAQQESNRWKNIARGFTIKIISTNASIARLREEKNILETDLQKAETFARLLSNVVQGARQELSFWKKVAICTTDECNSLRIAFIYHMYHAVRLIQDQEASLSEVTSTNTHLRAENGSFSKTLGDASRTNWELLQGIQASQQELYVSNQTTQGLQNELEDHRVLIFLQKQAFQQCSNEERAKEAKKLKAAQFSMARLRKEIDGLRRLLKRPVATPKAIRRDESGPNEPVTEPGKKNRDPPKPAVGDHFFRTNIPPRIEQAFSEASTSQASVSISKEASAPLKLPASEIEAEPKVEFSLGFDTKFSNNAVVPCFGPTPSATTYNAATSASSREAQSSSDLQPSTNQRIEPQGSMAVRKPVRSIENPDANLFQFEAVKFGSDSSAPRPPPLGAFKFEGIKSHQKSLESDPYGFKAASKKRGTSVGVDTQQYEQRAGEPIKQRGTNCYWRGTKDGEMFPCVNIAQGTCIGDPSRYQASGELKMTRNPDGSKEELFKGRRETSDKNKQDAKKAKLCVDCWNRAVGDGTAYKKKDGA